MTDPLLVRPTLFNYPMDPARGIEVTRSIVRAFFDRNLLGRAAADSVAGSFREVKVERYGPSAPG